MEFNLQKPYEGSLRNCDICLTARDAVQRWLLQTQPQEYTKIVENDEDWEPARYEWEQIVKWMLSPISIIPTEQ